MAKPHITVHPWTRGSSLYCIHAHNDHRTWAFADVRELSERWAATLEYNKGCAKRLGAWLDEDEAGPLRPIKELL